MHEWCPKVLHITCNIGSRDLPDMYALSPRACGPRAYISGKSLEPMLQLLHIPLPKSWYIYHNPYEYKRSSFRK